MATLEPGFETKARIAFKEEIEQTLYNEPGNLAHWFTQRVAERFRAYGSRFDIDVGPIIESMEVVEAERTLNGARIRVEWKHRASGIFEMGATPHRIRGNPVLSFVWTNPPQWVREEFDQARSGGGQFQSGWRVFLPEVQHPGVPEARAIRDTLLELRRRLS